MPRKSKIVEDLEVLQPTKDEEPVVINEVETEVSADEDEAIQAPKVEKVKKPRSEAQLAVFKRMKEKANEANEKRKLIKDEANKIQKEAKEEKIVKTAITIRRKQVKKQAILDDISDDDDTPMPVKKRVSIKEPVKIPEFIFV